MSLLSLVKLREDMSSESPLKSIRCGLNVRMNISYFCCDNSGENILEGTSFRCSSALSSTPLEDRREITLSLAGPQVFPGVQRALFSEILSEQPLRYPPVVIFIPSEAGLYPVD